MVEVDTIGHLRHLHTHAHHQVIMWRFLPVPQVDTPDPTAEELADMRVRICVGMKRYFHQKNVEGLLSNSVRAPLGCEWRLLVANQAACTVAFVLINTDGCLQGPTRWRQSAFPQAQ